MIATLIVILGFCGDPEDVQIEEPILVDVEANRRLDPPPTAKLLLCLLRQNSIPIFCASDNHDDDDDYDNNNDDDDDDDISNSSRVIKSHICGRRGRQTSFDCSVEERPLLLHIADVYIL